MIAETKDLSGDVRTPKPLGIMGVPVMPFDTYEQALACVQQRVESKQKSFCVAINPIKIHNSWQQPELRDLLRTADMCICDGVGVSIASWILCGRALRRITGCDLFFRLLRLASRKGWGVYLLGASPESNSAARKVLQEAYPDLRIVGCRDGYFEDAQEVIKDINASGADLLFVAMGSPKQEHWIWRHRQEIDASFCMGIGGSLDVAAGNVRRAPRFFRMTGTEFLFRFALEPRKRLSHQRVLLRFMVQVIRMKLSGVGQSAGWA